MPTYEFRCPKGHEFTRFYKTISASAMQLPCPECNEMAGRIMSVSAGFQFKGSGFYLTDYGRNAHRQEGGRRKEEGGEKKSDAPAKVEAATPAPSSDTTSAKPKAESREPKAETAKPKAEKPKARSDSRKPRAE